MGTNHSTLLLFKATLHIELKCKLIYIESGMTSNKNKTDLELERTN